MEKVNPFKLPRPQRPVEERTFASDGVAVTLALRVPDTADMNMAAEVARRLTADFITGYPDEGRPAADFYDGIKVSEALFVLAASIEQMQPPDRHVYNAVEIVVLLDRLPTDGPRIAAWARALQRGWQTAPGNSPGNSLGATTDGSSVVCSASEASTPRSPSGETISSAA